MFDWAIFRAFNTVATCCRNTTSCSNDALHRRLRLGRAPRRQRCTNRCAICAPRPPNSHRNAILAIRSDRTKPGQGKHRRHPTGMTPGNVLLAPGHRLHRVVPLASASGSKSPISVGIAKSTIDVCPTRDNGGAPRPKPTRGGAQMRQPLLQSESGARAT